MWRVVSVRSSGRVYAVARSEREAYGWRRRPIRGSVLGRLATGAVMLAAGCTGGSGAGASGSASAGAVAQASVACQTSNLVASADQEGWKIVLGDVSVQPGDLGPTLAVSAHGPWRYWQKRGIMVLAGTAPVSVTVPVQWRRFAAITWGDSPIAYSVLLRPCRSPARAWDAWAGGFYLQTASACVPIVFGIGRRHETVRFGVGRPCR